MPRDFNESGTCRETEGQRRNDTQLPAALGLKNPRDNEARLLRGHCTVDNQPNAAPEPTNTESPATGETEGHGDHDNQCAFALGLISDIWHTRQNFVRSKVRLELAAQAVCRQRLGGGVTFGKGDEDASKAEAAKMWAAVMRGKSEDGDLALALHPYVAAIGEFKRAIAARDRELKRVVRGLPIWTEWAAGVRGLGEVTFGGMLAEAGDPVETYKSPSALWKRFGLAVLGGERQRRVTDPELALLHGYSPQRRSLIYVVGDCMLRAQGADGPYKQVYTERKEYETPRVKTKGHAHNRALRYMTKRLLRDWYRASRRVAA